jgi:hypothetical protein
MEPICPYPGLRPFNEEESIFFKGREQQVESIVKRLEEKKFLMVNGASGDGKSSLIFAGVIPYAKAGFFKAKYNNWLVADFRPERAPLRNIAASVCRQLKIENLSDTEKKLGYGFSALCDLYKSSSCYVDENSNEWKQADEAQKKALKRKGANLLILVDQFEEFFTNPENYHNGIPSIESQKTINLLLETYKIAAAQQLPIYVVCTMRSDYIGQCAAFRGLAEAIGYSQFFVPRLKRQEIEQVIEGPAELAGGKIAKRLTQTLINNLTEGFDQLPILQHALNHVWKMADNGTKELDLIHLAQVGGVSPKVLALEDREKFNHWFEQLPDYKKQLLQNPSLSNVLNAHANELYLTAHLHYKERFGEAISIERSQKIIKGVFTCLTKVDTGRAVRNRMTLEEISQIILDEHSDSATIDKLLSIYREQGNTFIQPFLEDGESYHPLSSKQVLDITHESLIRNWSQLNEWANEEYEHLQNYLDFSKQLERWVNNNYSNGFLLPIGPLTYFEAWFERLRPNKYWILRYKSSSENEERKLMEAEKRLEEAKSFIQQSTKKLFFTRFILKYGANKIAILLGLFVTLLAITYFYFDYRTKQNDSLVEQSISKGQHLLLDKNIHDLSKAKFIIALDRLRESNRQPTEFRNQLGALKNDTIALFTCISMIQELTKKAEDDTVIYNQSGHYSTLVFNYETEIYLRFLDEKMQKLKGNKLEDLNLDEMNWVLGTCMLMKFCYPQNTNVRNNVKKITTSLSKLLTKGIENGDYAKLGINNENLTTTFLSLIAVEDNPDYRGLLSQISPFESKTDVQKNFENLFAGKPELYLNWNKQPQGGYYELLSLLYATEFESNPLAKEHLKQLITTSLKLNFGLYDPKIINDVLLKFCKKIDKAMDYINSISSDLENELFVKEKPKSFFIHLVSTETTFQPQHSKINFFIPEQNKAILWKEAEKILLKNQSVVGKLSLANFYKLLGHYHLHKAANETRANYFFNMAVSVFESISETERDLEFEKAKNTKDVWSSETFRFLFPKPMSNFEYINKNNSFTTSPGYTDFVQSKQFAHFYRYIVKHNKFNYFASNAGFEIIKTINETQNAILRNQTDSIIVSVYNKLLKKIETKYHKDLNAQYVYAKLNLSSTNKDFENVLRTELFSNKSFGWSYETISEKLQIENIRLTAIARNLMERNQSELADSVISLMQKQGKTESLLNLWLRIIDKELPEMEMLILARMHAARAEEKTYWAPEFFRLLGRTGGHNIENFALEQIREYPEMGKAILLQKYYLGLLESNRYFKAIKAIPEYTAKSGLLEKYATLILNEAIKNKLSVDKGMHGNWNDYQSRNYITNIDEYFRRSVNQ